MQAALDEVVVQDRFNSAARELEKFFNTDELVIQNVGFCRLGDEDHLGECFSHSEKGTPHNALACQMDSGLRRVHRFITTTEHDDDVEYSLNMFILILYLEVEKLHTVFRVLGITHDWVQENWPILVEIRKWANFVKHPKGFLFTHHPNCIIEGQPSRGHTDRPFVLNYDFVVRLYNHEDDQRWKQTIKELANKDDVVVVFPDPDRVAREYIAVCQSFCDKIKVNEHFKGILRRITTIEDY
ncbi:MAG TPA: hypothetical protein PK760_01990 [Flavobacteriales bacterium]|nr:hypothetical protein [Flavobacteriales bacterium]